jgi:alpha-amylase
VGGVCKKTCSSGFILCGNECREGSDCGKDPLPGCEIFTDNSCQGDNVDTPEEYANRRWFTPRPGDIDYKESFGDYWRLVAHAHLVYNADRQSAKIQLIATHKDGASLFFLFDGEAQAADTRIYHANHTAPVVPSVIASDGARVDLQPITFTWAFKAIADNGDTRNGQKVSIVELFGWPHQEITEECKTLSQMGWSGVRLFPSHEQVMASQPFNGIMNPWYFMYQPISYRFEGRMGNYTDIMKLISTCRKYNVRVYADAVVNHMTGNGNDSNPDHRNSNGGSCTYWPGKNSSAVETSPYYTQGYTYTHNPHTGMPPSQEFPAVPYGPLDFHCERSLNSWTSGTVMNAGWLSGLTDLNTERPYVRSRIADYFVSLISAGFSGFRVDAAKHMQPDDLIAIFDEFRGNMGGALPDDFITWWEVLLGGEADMLLCNEKSGYNYGKYIENGFAAKGWPQSEINKIKIWLSGYPKEPQADCGAISRTREAIQNDDHDQQNPGSSSRDMGDQGSVFIKDKNIDAHRNFEVKLFTNPNGASNNDDDYPVRLLLSSYFFGSNGEVAGVPDGKSDCSKCQFTCDGCQGMPYVKAHNSSSCGYDMSEYGYTRTHRDTSVINAMRSWLHLPQKSPSELGLPSNC